MSNLATHNISYERWRPVRGPACFLRCHCSGNRRCRRRSFTALRCYVHALRWWCTPAASRVATITAPRCRCYTKSVLVQCTPDTHHAGALALLMAGAAALRIPPPLPVRGVVAPITPVRWRCCSRSRSLRHSKLKVAPITPVRWRCCTIGRGKASSRTTSHPSRRCAGAAARQLPER